MTPLSHAHAHQPPRIWIGPRTRAAITLQIEELQAQRKRIRNPAKREAIDARVKVLLSLLVSVATAAVLVLTLSSPASARDPCGPYMDSNGCLRAIQISTNLCVGRLYKAAPTSGEVLDCVRAAMAAAGATFQLEIEKPGEARK